MNKKQAENLAYQTVWNAAIEAANKAGDAWMEKARPQWAVMDGNKCVGTMLDVCGFAWIKFTDKRSKFYRWYRENIENNYNFMSLPHKYARRQEMGLKEVAIRAALEVFDRAGITGLGIYVNID